jgi:F0F1-type ATP synthase epsilon subunit
VLVYLADVAQRDTDYVAVSGGFIEVRPDKVTVLSSSAEEANHIDMVCFFSR